MPTPAFPALTALLPATLAFLLGTLAAYVSLGLVRHAHDLPPRDRQRWLAVAAVGLGSAAWLVAPVAQSGLDGKAVAAYSVLGLAAAWLLAVAVAVASLALATRPPLGWGRVLAGAVLFGLTGMSSPLLGAWSAGLGIGAQDGTAALAAAGLLAQAGALTAYALCLRGPGLSGRWAAPAQVAGALALGLAASLAEGLSGAAWVAPLRPVSSPLIGASPAGVMSFAALAALVLAAAIGVVHVVDARVRKSRAEMRAELQSRSVRDALTGLPNGQSFDGTLAQAVRLADVRSGRLALLYLSLDGMGPINTSYGHHGGDRVLKEVARRLRELGQPHMVARLHSDEFLLLMTEDPSREDVLALAARAQQVLGKPIQLVGHEAIVSCSIGVALYPEDASRAKLIANASVAMRAAKRSGGATCSFFDPRLLDDAIDRAELFNDLRHALGRGQFELYYQPKVHAPSGEITGAEALLRWKHPSRGTISPVVFVPLAERHGMICALGDWVIEQACDQARQWRDQGLRMRVAINLSPVQLRQPDLARKISAALTRHRVNPELLTCEITESVALEDTPATRQVFSELEKIGVHISIDDFGSGYSNLANLRKLPASELKIDRSFVIDLVGSEEARGVVRAVVGLAKALDRQVVAEGVETEAQYQILRELGCDHLQGYLFAKPMTAAALGVWAMHDVGPRSIQFRASLFKDTRVTVPAG